MAASSATDKCIVQMDPYTAPDAALKDPVAPESAVADREAHVRHEMLLKSLGYLYGLFSILLLVVGFGALSFALIGARPTDFIVPIGVLMVGLVSLVLAFGFHALRPWVATPGTILSAECLLIFPIGTLINAYVLYLIWCGQGRRVLSPDYRDVIAMAPTVRYRRSKGDWLAIGILGAMAILGWLAIGVVQPPLP